MPLEPWYRVVTSRPEARESRSFSPDEFAIAEFLLTERGREYLRETNWQE